MVMIGIRIGIGIMNPHSARVLASSESGHYKILRHYCIVELLLSWYNFTKYIRHALWPRLLVLAILLLTAYSDI